MGLLCHFLVSTMNGQRKQKGLILLAKQQRIINENEQRPLKINSNHKKYRSHFSRMFNWFFFFSFLFFLDKDTILSILSLSGHCIVTNIYVKIL